MTTSDPRTPMEEYEETVDWVVELGVDRAAAQMSLAWAKPHDPTPGDHDARVESIARELERDGQYHAADALRTEQSARQELLESHQQAWNNAALWKEDRDALQQRIDAALTLLGELIWNEEDLGAVAFVRAALTAPTVSTEYGRPFTCAELGHENCDGSHPDHHVEE